MDDRNELRLARDEIRLLRSELAEQRRIATDATQRWQFERQQVRRMADQLSALRRSRSWWVTRPLRALRRRQEGPGL